MSRSKYLCIDVVHKATFRSLILLITAGLSSPVNGQSLKSVSIINDRISQAATSDGNKYQLDIPVVSYVAARRGAIDPKAAKTTISGSGTFSNSLKFILTFLNTTSDTVSISNVVPFGESQDRVYITGLGNHSLSRTHIFIPNRKPVNVIVPDNAWELGYCEAPLNSSFHLCGLARRDHSSIRKGKKKRFETLLYPGGSVSYTLFFDVYSGEWQQGLKKVFQEKMLYDVGQFDNSLYQRKDLAWINKAYVMHLLMAWDKSYYDNSTGKFNLPEFVKKGKSLYGGDDVICLWPTWPTLGMDQRNQFDMYRDLPGGLPALRALADTLRKLSSKFFIAYNPWDESTRSEGHLQGLEYLIKETSADGVVLDTKGESSKELQAAADKVKGGVIMYSEGMAVPKDMNGIVSGRVHNALYHPPQLNLNKLIKPDFAIFRVAEVYKEPILREYATSFFNGYGTEINQFAPGHPDWENEQYKFLGRTTMILRENNENFTSQKFTPLIPTPRDSIWVNQWDAGQKKIYTIFSLKPEGFEGKLFRTKLAQGFHCVDLWNHAMVSPIKVDTVSYVPASIEPFSSKFLGTNNEGAVSCMAVLPEILKVVREGSILKINASKDCVIKVWNGSPDYGKTSVNIADNKGEIDLLKAFGNFEGKIIVQAFRQDQLLDEVIIETKAGTPILVSRSEKTPGSEKTPSGMVKIPAGKFTFHSTHGDEFIPYPKNSEGHTFEMPEFYMDKFPVSNKQFKDFLDATHYRPQDTVNFLKNWSRKSIPRGQENFPVVCVSYEDAKAYAQWAGKRLPTEIEWQYAAQTSSQNEWPWKQARPVARKEEIVTETLTVFSLEGIDPKMCNLGDGKMHAVGSYPKGANPFGLNDLVGSVWQLTNDIYESGSYRYIMMKGGSYFKPSSSWWYVQGGPRELHYKQYLLRVSEGFERNATVGFRCIKDK
jgi:gamma-glutamyl hercynylcysteine S-oxide synthase